MASDSLNVDREEAKQIKFVSKSGIDRLACVRNRRSEIRCEEWRMLSGTALQTEVAITNEFRMRANQSSQTFRLARKKMALFLCPCGFPIKGFCPSMNRKISFSNWLINSMRIRVGNCLQAILPLMISKKFDISLPQRGFGEIAERSSLNHHSFNVLEGLARIPKVSAKPCGDEVTSAFPSGPEVCQGVTRVDVV